MPKEFDSRLSKQQKGIMGEHANVGESLGQLILRVLNETNSKQETARRFGITNIRLGYWMGKYCREVVGNFPNPKPVPYAPARDEIKRRFRKNDETDEEFLRRLLQEHPSLTAAAKELRIPYKTLQRFVKNVLPEVFKPAQAATDVLRNTISITEETAQRVQREHPYTKGYELYRLFASELPNATQGEILANLMNTAQSDDPELSARATNTFMLLTLKTTINAVNSFNPEPDEADEFVEIALNSVRRRTIKTPSNIKLLSSHIYGSAKRAIEQYISKKEKMPSIWVHQKQYILIKNEILRAQEEILAGRMDEQALLRLVLELAKRTGYSTSSITTYIKSEPPKKERKSRIKSRRAKM